MGGGQGQGLGWQRQANLSPTELARTYFDGTVIGQRHVAHDGKPDTVPGYRLVGPRTTLQDLGDLIGIDSRPVIFDFDCQVSFFRACKNPTIKVEDDGGNAKGLLGTILAL